MTKSGQAQDEAMNAILASIRSMMADDSDIGVPTAVQKQAEAAPLPDNVSTLFSELPTAGDAVAATGQVARDEPVGDNGRVRTVNGAVDPAVERAMTLAMQEARAEVEHAGAGPNEEPQRQPAMAPVADEPISQAVPAPPVGGPARQEDVDTADETGRALSGQPLMSPVADAAVSKAFSELASSMLSRSSRSIDEMAEDLLRPMLRDWLDTSLPPLVERLVREEIERVSRGRR